MDKRFYNVIKKPVLSEKSYKNFEKNTYTFEVLKDTNKTEVKKIFEILFSVKIENINIINKKRKKRRVGKYTGFKSEKKYAIIKLKKGYSLNIVGDDQQAKQVASDSKISKIKEKLFDVTKSVEKKQDKSEKELTKSITSKKPSAKKPSAKKPSVSKKENTATAKSISKTSLSNELVKKDSKNNSVETKNKNEKKLPLKADSSKTNITKQKPKSTNKSSARSIPGSENSKYEETKEYPNGNRRIRPKHNKKKSVRKDK